MDMRTAIIRIFECGSVSSACILRRQSALWSGASRAVFCLPSSGVSERFWYPPLLLVARLHFWISETACTGWSKSRRSETPNLHRGNSCSLNVSAPVYRCCNQGFRTNSGSLPIFPAIRRALAGVCSPINPSRPQTASLSFGPSPFHVSKPDQTAISYSRL